MPDYEPKTEPAFYERSLSDESALARVTIEDRKEALEAKLDETTGIARIKLNKQIERLDYMLEWQGANPKELDQAELREVNTQPLHIDSSEDAQRERVRNPKTAIRAYCTFCQGGYLPGIRDCGNTICPLWSFRMGGDPFRGFALPKPIEVELTPEELENDEDIFDEDDEDEGEDD